MGGGWCRLTTALQQKCHSPHELGDTGEQGAVLHISFRRSGHDVTGVELGCR